MYSIGDINVLSDEQRREVTSSACLEAIQTGNLQRKKSTKRAAQGAIDWGWTCYTGPSGRWFFTLYGNALSLPELLNIDSDARKDIKCHRVMYKRKGSGILDTALGPIICAWVTAVECVLKLCYYEDYKVMHAACQPVELSDGEVFDVRIPGIEDNVLFNGTVNHHTLRKEDFVGSNRNGSNRNDSDKSTEQEEDQKQEKDDGDNMQELVVEEEATISMPHEIIGMHQDKNDHKAGIAVTTDGVGPDPAAFEGGQLNLYDGYFKPNSKRASNEEKKETKASDLPHKQLIVSKPVGQTAFAKLHNIWHWVSPGILCKEVDATRWSFIAQQKQDVVEQLAFFRKNPDVYIVSTEEKKRLRREGWLSPTEDELLEEGGLMLRITEGELHDVLRHNERYGAGESRSRQRVA